MNETANTTSPAAEVPKRKRSRYWIGLLALLLVNALLITLALRWLYTALEKYEAGTPGAAINRYFDALDAGEYNRILAESGFQPNQWNTSDDYIAYIQQLYARVPIKRSYRQLAATTEDGWQVFAIYSGDTRVGEICLFQLPGGGWQVMAPKEELPVYTITAPAFASVTANGIVLGEGDVADRQPVPLFAELPKDFTIPETITYFIGPIFNQPKIEVSAGQAEYRLEEDPEAENAWTVTAHPTPAQEKEFAESLTRAAQTYAKYVSLDATADELLPLLLPDTDFYSRVKGMTDRMWYIDHERFEFEDLTCSNFVFYSETCFIGEIDFTYVVYQGSKIHRFPTHYTMSFCLQNGHWQLVDMRV